MVYLVIYWIFELQEGLTAEETTKKEPDESQHMQVIFHFLPQYHVLLNCVTISADH